jgi:hypothetical protein
MKCVYLFSFIYTSGTLTLILTFVNCVAKFKFLESWSKSFSRSYSQEIGHLLWNSQIHYHVYKCQPLCPSLFQMNEVHILTYCFFKTHFNIILSSTRKMCEWFLVKIYVSFLISPICINAPPISSFLICLP